MRGRRLHQRIRLRVVSSKRVASLLASPQQVLIRLLADRTGATFRDGINRRFCARLRCRGRTVATTSLESPPSDQGCRLQSSSEFVWKDAAFGHMLVAICYSA